MSLSLSTTPARKPVAPLLAFAILLFGAVFLQNSVGSRQVLLLVVGAALGLTLYHAAFGFTSAWRVFITDRRGAGLRAQMVMLAIAV
ncbi:YeeE/YedE family protein, partial [Pseudomonas sp. K5002]|nr:YeeE/YedE family protein [Pseudomonas sp. K5002]